MKKRIDILLVEGGFVESRIKAQWLIKNGYVLVNRNKIIKPSKRIENSLEIQLIRDFPYIGRGGFKLEAALRKFSISVKGKICADIGASIGGFTDCLIKNGAAKVYAIDIATDFIHPLLRNENMKKKIITILGVDARNLIHIDEFVDLCTVDLTFTSLREVLPNVRDLLRKNGDIIVLVKPIFEIEFHNKKKFDVIKDPHQLFQILRDLFQWNLQNHFYPVDIIKSPIEGKGGSIEFLIHLKIKKFDVNLDYTRMIRDILL